MASAAASAEEEETGDAAEYGSDDNGGVDDTVVDPSQDSLEAAAQFIASSGTPVSRSFITNKPHKAHDAAWEAIRAAATATATTAKRNGGGPSESDCGYIGFGHFRFLQRLGGGDIGHVYLTELVGHDKRRPSRGDNTTNGCIVSSTSKSHCYFAMKIMDKHALRKRNKLHRARTEREILETLDHPFLPTLYAHIDDHRYSCLVMEFCPGGDLHVLRQLQPGKRFREDAVRFYAAEVLMALEYLHMMGVVYRDLKPENVLVREDGHIMLSDFDLSLKCTVNPTLNMMARGNGGGIGSDDPSRYLEQEGWGSPAVAARSGEGGGGLCSSSTNRSTTTTSCVNTAMAPLGCIAMPPPYCSIHPITSCLPIRRLLPSGRTRKARGRNRNVRWNEAPEPRPELLAEPTGARSMSFVGTHEYLAPEIILGEGHGAAVDWWTLGIFLYELLYGRTPFKGGDNEATLTNVVTRLLKFPAPAKYRHNNGAVALQSVSGSHEAVVEEEDSTPPPSMEAQDLIRGLLVKDPSKRMGAVKGATEVKQHSFFRGVNWALIRCATPPEIPSPFVVATATAKESGHGHDRTHSSAVAAMAEEDRLDSKWNEDSENDNDNDEEDDDDDHIDYDDGHFMNGGRAATPEFEFF